MRSTIVLSALLALPIGFGCASPEPTVERDEPELNLSSSSSGGAASSSSSGGGAGSSSGSSTDSQGCVNDGVHGLTITGEGFWSSAGEAIWVSAIEGTIRGPSGAVEQTLSQVLVGSVGTDGSFTLSCASGLGGTQNPSWGLWLDRDGDGKCGAGDLVMRRTLYAWAGDETRVTPEGSDSGEVWVSPDASNPSGLPFCAYYNFPR
jgi:hypothetical protein